MPTDPVLPLPPQLRPTATAALRRQVWVSAMFLAWGAFALGRWTEAAEPWLFSSVFRGCLGAVLVVAAIFGLRNTLEQMRAGPGVDTALGRHPNMREENHE